jgi:hypothetical protein
MLKNQASILLVAALVMVPLAAAAQPGKHAGVTTTAAGKGGAVTEASLVQRYKDLAGGSEDNAKSLVHGLRMKEKVVLVGPSMEPPPPPPCIPGSRFCKPTTTTTSAMETVEFMPQTDAMGWGNVDVALALAEADLKAKSVATPKPRQLKAALEGGSVGGLSFDGILALRAAGAGWGDIAKSLGFELK